MIIDILYFEKGKEKQHSLDIKFISNGVVRDFSEHLQKITDVQYWWEEIVIMTAEMATAPKEMQKEIKEKIAQIKKQIEAVSNDGLMKKRLELTVRILDDNGIDVTELRENRFWDTKVEPSAWISFLYKAVYKDVDLKKKALTR